MALERKKGRHSWWVRLRGTANVKTLFALRLSCVEESAVATLFFTAVAVNVSDTVFRTSMGLPYLRAVYASLGRNNFFERKQDSFPLSLRVRQMKANSTLGIRLSQESPTREVTFVKKNGGQRTKRMLQAMYSDGTAAASLFREYRFTLPRVRSSGLNSSAR